jgi:outer membrane protein OmpA-like peptidoglycan-associated protein
MRTLSFRLPLTLTLALLAAPAAWAQVSVDPRALDPLTPPSTSGAAKPAPVKPAPAKPAATPAASSAGNSTGKPPAATNSTVRPLPGGPASPPAGNLPAVPATPPSPIVLPPPVAVPTRAAPPPTAPPIAADAPGVATAMAGGLRIGFGPGRADLNPATETAIRALARGGPGVTAAAENASFTITSFAAGTPEDPSTARRLSLSRATAVRSVLIAQGVASVRIYVRALGPASPGFADGPPDRADLVVGPPVMPTPAATPPAKPTASKP